MSLEIFTTAHAASEATCVAQSFLAKINDAVFFPLIVFLTALALLMFLWGAFRYLWSANAPASRETGSKHMLYGVIGLLVMTSAFAILSIAANSLDVGGLTRPGETPSGCTGERAPGIFGGGNT